MEFRNAITNPPEDLPGSVSNSVGIFAKAFPSSSGGFPHRFSSFAHTAYATAKDGRPAASASDFTSHHEP